MASNITNYITTVFKANAGNTIAVMNQIAGGASNLGRASMNAGRGTNFLSNQLRAMATTFRYAVAGSVVFGATRMISTLMDVQRQFGLLTVLGEQSISTMGGATYQNKLVSFYHESEEAALRALTPINEFNDGMINLFSTIGNVKGQEAIDMMEGIAKGAQLAQISTEEMTRTVAGINQAFGGPETAQQFDRLTRSFFKLTAEAPGGIAFGPQFVTQLPQLAAVSRLARISPAQMYGLYLTTLRTGGSPATAGRGLQYLLQSIAVPASDESRKALAQAGINPTMVQQQGGYAALKGLIAHAKSLGISGDVTAAAKTPDEVLDLLEGATPTEIGQGLGISGKGLDWLSQAIGRIHGVRALVTLIAQSNQTIDRMEADQKMIAQAYAGNEKAQRDFARTWDKFVKQQPLKAAQISIDGVRRSMIELLEVPANYVARGISRVGQTAVEHPKWAHRAEAGGLAFLGLYGISRAMGKNPLGRAGGFLGRITGAAGQTWMTQNAIKDAMGPEAGIRGASPQNPLYVTVVRDLFGGGGRGNDPTTPPIVTDVPGKTSRFGRAVRFAGKVTAIGAITAAAAEAGNELRGGRGGLEFGLDYPVDFYKRLWRGMTRSHRQRDPREIIMGQYRHGQLSRQDAQRQVAVAGRQLPQLQRLSEIINRFSPRQPVTTVLGIQRRHREMIHGRAQIVLDIRLEKDGKIRTKRVHVPVDMFQNGVYPSNRGNPRTNRKVN